MQKLDEYIPRTVSVTVHGAFPPIKNRVLRFFRPLLRMLHIHRAGEYTLILHQMTLETYFKYIQVYLSLFDDTEQDNLISGIKDSIERSQKIYLGNPALLQWATGIDDMAFFGNLDPTEFVKIENAIADANPAKKNMMLKITMAHMDLIAKMLTDGLTQFTSLENSADGTLQKLND